jgi:hypothetical protein
MENGTQRQSDAVFPASENFLEAQILEMSSRNFSGNHSPIFEEEEDLHFRDIMPIHAQSDESESEIGSENPAVCANQIPVDQHFANQIPDESNLQNVQAGNFFLANQMGNQGQIGQIWPESQTGCHNQGEGGPTSLRK